MPTLGTIVDSLVASRSARAKLEAHREPSPGPCLCGQWLARNANGHSYPHDRNEVDGVGCGSLKIVELYGGNSNDDLSSNLTSEELQVAAKPRCCPEVIRSDRPRVHEEFVLSP